MRKNLLLLFLVVCCAIFFPFCKKENKPYEPVQLCADLTRNMDSINKYIHGTWDWVEEKRRNQITRQYEYLTPRTEGYTLRLKLSGDTAQYWVNNNPTSTHRFRVMWESDLTGLPEDSLPVLVYLNSNGIGGRYVPIKICKEQLVMQYQFVSSVVGTTIWQRK